MIFSPLQPKRKWSNNILKAGQAPVGNLSVAFLVWKVSLLIYPSLESLGTKVYSIYRLTSFSNVSLIAFSKASYEVGTAAPASFSAWFFAWADSISPPLLAPWFTMSQGRFRICLLYCNDTYDLRKIKGDKVGQPLTAWPNCTSDLKSRAQVPLTQATTGLFTFPCFRASTREYSSLPPSSPSTTIILTCVRSENQIREGIKIHEKASNMIMSSILTCRLPKSVNGHSRKLHGQNSMITNLTLNSVLITDINFMNEHEYKFGTWCIASFSTREKQKANALD